MKTATKTTGLVGAAIGGGLAIKDMYEHRVTFSNRHLSKITQAVAYLKWFVVALRLTIAAISNHVL